MASNTDDTFAQYKTYAGIAIGGVLLAVVLDACTAPSEEDIAEAKAAQEAVVEARRMAIENPGAEAEEKIKPIETLAVAEKSAAPTAPRDGAAVYQAACMACHAAGVLEAPKLEAGAWDARISKGLDGLTTSAINGINSMPARGGNPAITDEEMKNAVAYMLTESGYDPDALGETEEKEAVAVATIDPAVMEEIKAAAESAKAAAEEAKVAAAEAQAAAEEAKASMTASAGAIAAVGAGAAAMATMDADGAETEVADTVETMDADSADAEAADTMETMAGSVGKQVYDNTCFTCHDVGIFGSPITTDTAAWNERIAKGIDALYVTAINGNGTNTKPAKGGHPDLSEAQVKAAVDYMLDTAGVDLSADAGMAATEEKAETEAVEAAQETQPEGEAADATTEEKAEDATQEEAQPEAETAEQEAQPEAEATEESADATQASAAAGPSWASIDGEKIYRGICFSCHDMGVAQAPVLGKATAWEARIAAGMETLYNNSINGKGIMPAKGGNPSLSDDEIRAAVDWMVEQVQ